MSSVEKPEKILSSRASLQSVKQIINKCLLTANITKFSKFFSAFPTCDASCKKFWAFWNGWKNNYFKKVLWIT